MTYTSNRPPLPAADPGLQALPASGAGTRSRRPASRLRRRFFVVSCKLLALLLAACITPPAAVEVGSSPQAPARVVDANGQLPPREADAVVRRLERASDS